MANLEALKELRRVVAETPANELNAGAWTICMGGRASRDPWFRKHGVREPSFPAFQRVLDVDYHDVTSIMSWCHYQTVIPENYGVLHEEAFAKIDALIERARAEKRQAEIGKLCLDAVAAALADDGNQFGDAKSRELEAA